MRLPPTTLGRHGLAALLFLGLALLSLAPVLPQATTTIWGGPIAAVDGWQHTWHLWWVAHAVSTGQNPFVTPLLFAPDGAELYLQPLNLTTGLLLLPVTLLAGPIAAYNLAALLSLLLGGLAGYLLAWEVSRNYLGALLAGFVFAWSPFHLTRLYDGQLELASIQWPAFYALALLVALRGGRVRMAVIAGLLLAVVGYTSWYYLLFMLVWSVAFGLLYLGTNGTWLAAPSMTSPSSSFWARGTILVRQGGLIGLLAFVVLAPALIPALASRLSPDPNLPPVDPQEVQANAANLLDFGLPSYLHPLWGDAVAAGPGAAWHPLTGDWNVALGYSILLLALLGLIWAGGSGWPWLLLALLGIGLALGPVLQVGTWQGSVPMPYQWLASLPGADFGRRPLHFTLLTVLALTPLVALGLRELFARANQRTPLVATAVVLVLMLELLPVRGTLHQAKVHSYYANLGPDSGALLHVPLPLYKQVSPQLAQIQHAAPLIGGYLARIPNYPLLDAPGIRPLRLMRADPGELLEPTHAALSALNYYGVRQVLVDWPAIHPDRHPLLAEALAQVLPGVAPTYADPDLSVYLVPAVEPAPFGFFGPGWHDEEGPTTQRWRWMGPHAELTLVNPTDETQVADLAIHLTSYRYQREVTLMLEHEVIAIWDVPPQPGEVQRTLHLLVPPSEQTLELGASASTELTDAGRELSVALLDVALLWHDLLADY
ncbi:MAG: hypothetical protein AB4911_13210 [Oscillochloridaceae bacterium umkhey_bin13]